MEIAIGVLILAFIIGLLTRSKGDGFLDTLSSGCGSLVVLVIIIIVVIAFLISKG